MIVALMACSASAGPSLKIGSPAPSFDLKLTSGQPLSLEKYLGRDVIILSFFASWSKTCQQEISYMQELERAYGRKGLSIIGVSYDRKTGELKDFLNDNKVAFPVAHDQKLKTLQTYRVIILPTLIVIDRQGNISQIYLDFDGNVEKALDQDIQRLLTTRQG
ncbi:MAG: TlpA family protein disulfide reductase [Candidatus Saganbacteria bacterium]|nr:TlpA family protein disulfide reductase [Candidatus Saganbacteria bacterium]